VFPYERIYLVQKFTHDAVALARRAHEHAVIGLQLAFYGFVDLEERYRTGVFREAMAALRAASRSHKPCLREALQDLRQMGLGDAERVRNLRSRRHPFGLGCQVSSRVQRYGARFADLEKVDHLIRAPLLVSPFVLVLWYFYTTITDEINKKIPCGLFFLSPSRRPYP
jgi:hypothetical protein